MVTAGSKAESRKLLKANKLTAIAICWLIVNAIVPLLACHAAPIGGVEASPHVSCSREATAPNSQSTSGSLRLTRTAPYSVKFLAPPQGVSLRWLRNLRKPPFCPFILCHSTCSSITGQFMIGGDCGRTVTSDEPGPCSIKPVDFRVSPGGCCSSAPGTVSLDTVSGDSI